jgi:hypothetical protein
MGLKKRQIDRIQYLIHGLCFDEFREGKISHEAVLQKYRRIVEEMETPEELHQFVSNYNWDDGIDRLQWVISHPLCDQGTALLVFWLSDPAYFYEFPKVTDVSKWARPQWTFLKTIEQKYLDRSFSSQKIKVDPANIWGSNYLQIPKTAEGAGLLRIPYGMCVPSPGRSVERLSLA